jgi:hypothetical protein
MSKEVRELFGKSIYPEKVVSVSDTNVDTDKRFPLLEIETRGNAFSVSVKLDGKELFCVQSVEIKASNEDFCMATITIPVRLKQS